MKFEVAVTGSTRTWTDGYPVLRIHRDIASLRAPGRMMRSDALALDGATIADIRRGTAFDSRWYMNGGERGSEERRGRERRTFTPLRDQQNRNPTIRVRERT